MACLKKHANDVAKKTERVNNYWMGSCDMQNCQDQRKYYYTSLMTITLIILYITNTEFKNCFSFKLQEKTSVRNLIMEYCYCIHC